MYNNFSSKKTKKVISALLASALVVTSAPITANAATAKVLGVGKTFTVKKTTKVSGLSKAEKKIVKVTVNKKKRTVTVKGVKAGKATFKIGKKAYTVKVGATSIAKKTVTTSMTAGETKTLSVKATNGKGDTIQFTSSKKGVVKVNKASVTASKKTGVAATKVTAVAEGTAKITAKSKFTGKSKAFTITVKAAATPTPATQPPTVATTPAVTGGATTAPTATAGTQASATPGTDATQNPDATPGTDATQNPDATPGTDATQAPGTDATQAPGTDATQAPDVPVAKTGTITVTTNVTEAAIKVISGTSVVAETTTDGTTTSATFADLANGTYTIEVSKAGYGTYTTTQVVAGSTYTINADLEAATVTGIKCLSETRVQVNFNVELDEVATTNFTISDTTVKSATLTADKKSVILETSNLTKDTTYTLKVSGLTTNKIAIADTEDTFVGKEIKYEMKLSFSDNKTALQSNGQDTVLVTATLYDEEGELVKDLDKVEIKFSTTAGSFAETKVTAQNGKASNMLTSEISTSDLKALVTATVVSASNKNLLNVNTSATVLMQPNIATGEDKTMGATLTGIGVDTCDRIILYFNKDVDVADYTVQDSSDTKNVFGIDDNKMEIQIEDNAPNGQTTVKRPNKTVKYLKAVPNNSKALEAILDVDAVAGNYLTDNTNLVVQVTDKSKNVYADATATTLVSEIRVPSILSVENDGLRSIKVTFSEPIQNDNGSGNNDYSAEVLGRWVIDGTPLGDARWGDASTPEGKAATATVGTFDKLTGEDTRNIVTITLGKKSDGSQIYFTSGDHSIQGNNIGDWANMTDRNNNLINTQTLDFSIAPDETIPDAKVEVESPEQYTLKFNKAVEITEVVKNLKLQHYSTTSSTWVDKDTVANGGIVVTAVDAKYGVATEFVVEVTEDWTADLNTSKTKENYYNHSYRLHFDANTIVNVANGKKNAEINDLLNDEIMTTPDIVSPEIESVVQEGTTNSFTITMSEPVQVPNLGGTEVITKSETQATTGVPTVTVTFIKDDNSVTVPAKIKKMVDAHDKAFVVEPAQTLAAGKYSVVVASISDDVGNTSKTLADQKLNVKSATVVDTGFKALWAIGVPAGHKEPISGKSHVSTDDVVYIKFNKNFKTSGAAANAVSTTNYTVGGISIPDTSKIDVSLVDYNHKAVTKNGYSDLVAIHLKAGTLNRKTTESNSINISSTIEALAGGKLSNGGMKILNFVDIVGGTPIVGESDDNDYYAWNYGTYAEEVPVPPATTKELKSSDIQKLLDNTQYVEYDFDTNVNVTSDETADLKISHSGKYTFKATSEFKSLTINTNETGTIEIIGGVFGEINVTAPNADVIIDGTKINKTVNSIPGFTGKLKVEDVLAGTLTLKAGTEVEGDVEITDTNNGCTVDTSAATISGAIKVDTTDTVELNPAATGQKIVIQKAATVVFDAVPTETGSIELEAGSKGLTLKGATTNEVNDLKTALTDGTVALAKGETDTTIKPSADTIKSVGESLTLNKEAAFGITGYTLYSDAACTDEITSEGELVDDLTLTTKATTIYAKGIGSDDKSASDVKDVVFAIALTTTDSDAVTAKITGVTNRKAADGGVVATNFTVVGSEIAETTKNAAYTITPGQYGIAMTGVLQNSEYKFYSDSGCTEEIKSVLTIRETATKVYAKKANDSAITIGLNTADGKTITATNETNKKTVTVTVAGAVTIKATPLTATGLAKGSNCEVDATKNKITVTTQGTQATATVTVNDTTATGSCTNASGNAETGITFSSNTITVANTVEAGTYTLTLTAVDGDYSGTQTFTIVVPEPTA